MDPMTLDEFAARRERELFDRIRTDVAIPIGPRANGIDDHHEEQEEDHDE